MRWKLIIRSSCNNIVRRVSARRIYFVVGGLVLGFVAGTLYLFAFVLLYRYAFTTTQTFGLITKAIIAYIFMPALFASLGARLYNSRKRF